MSWLGEQLPGESYSEDDGREVEIPRSAIYTCLAILAALIIALVLYRDALGEKREWLAILAIGIGGVLLIMVQCKLLLEGWIDANHRSWLHSFYIRDRRGQTGLGQRLHKILTNIGGWTYNPEAESLRKLLSRQPNDFLFYLATDALSTIRRTSMALLGTEDRMALLQSYRDCPVSIKMILIESDVAPVRKIAQESMPIDLWPRAVQKLLRSIYPEARIAAVRCISEREVLRRVCRDDREDSVRLAAWRQLKSLSSQGEAVELIESAHSDVRTLVLNSGWLPRKRTVKVCRDDDENPIRTIAWKILEKDLNEKEAVELFGSDFFDVNLWAVRSGKLGHMRMRKICFKDHIEGLRLNAWEQIRDRLTEADAAYLIGSPNADTRLRAVQSGKLTHERLFRVALKDRKRMVRLETFEQLKAGLTESEIRSLTNSVDEEFRVYAVESRLLPRKRIAQLCQRDSSKAVRDAAWKILKNDLTRNEATFLSYSNYIDVCLWSLRSGLLSKWRTRRMVAKTSVRSSSSH